MKMSNMLSIQNMSIHAMSEIPQMVTPHNAFKNAENGHNNSQTLMASRLEELHQQNYPSLNFFN